MELLSFGIIFNTELMARKDQLKDTLEDAVKIGRDNAAILPEIRNWCRHIVLKDESAGLVAELYQLPMTTAVSCPHAGSGSTGMQLDWIAGSFIVENCVGCQFYQSVSEPNFGTRLLEEKKRSDEAAALELDKKKNTNRLLREHIEILINTSKSQAQITELSILQIVNGLNDATKKETNAVQIFEASKIDPEFFTPLSLDALSLHFEDQQVGGLCIKAVNEVLKDRSDFPDTPYQQVIKALKAGRHFNEAALLFRFYINAGNINEHEETIVLLLGHLIYYRMIGESFDQERDYRNSIDTIQYLIGLDRSLMQTLFRQRLGSEDTLVRINANYCLQEILSSDYSFVSDLTSELIQSFQLIDDATYDSADLACAITLAKLIKPLLHQAYSPIKIGISRLNSSGRGGAIRVYHYLLSDKDFIVANKAFCQELVEDLIALAMKKDEDRELREDYVDELHRLRYENIDLLEPSFDAFLGWLSQVTEQEKTFLWWLEEIETKKNGEVTTYNPLLGRDYFDIDRERNQLSKEIRHLADIVRDILKKDRGVHLGTARKILEGLDSRTQTKLKTTLINIISMSVEDPFIMAQFIPPLYNYLFDPDEVKIREEAMKFLDRLVSKHPHIINQTLFDVAELFLKDPEVAVKGMAIEVQASIANEIPDKFNPSNLNTLIDCMLDSYVYIHKKSARKCRVFYPLMSQPQRLIAIVSLMNLVEHYKDKDTSFVQDVLKDLLAISKGSPAFFNAAVKNISFPIVNPVNIMLLRNR